MQRFVGLNSIEGWNLTLQLSFTCFFWTGLRRNVDFKEKIYYNEKLVMSA